VSRTPSFVVFVIAVLGIVLACFVYGLGVLVFLTTLTSIFFLVFVVMYYGSLSQVQATPGIEKLDEPDGFRSRIYMAWLFVNDREGWAIYATLYSYFLAFVCGSLFGLALSAMSGIDNTGSIVGWVLGMFINFLAAIVIATSEKWKEGTGVLSEDQDPQNLSRLCPCEVIFEAHAEALEAKVI
jgi:hypothetical protein